MFQWFGADSGKQYVYIRSLNDVSCSTDCGLLKLRDIRQVWSKIYCRIFRGSSSLHSTIYPWPKIFQLQNSCASPFGPICVQWDQEAWWCCCLVIWLLPGCRIVVNWSRFNVIGGFLIALFGCIWHKYQKLHSPPAIIVWLWKFSLRAQKKGLI